jgi:hypothetical protein
MWKKKWKGFNMQWHGNLRYQKESFEDPFDV